ncbi:MAG: hypothetical protein AAF600_14450 [Bacteroidota bacterium]
MRSILAPFIFIIIGCSSAKKIIERNWKDEKDKINLQYMAKIRAAEKKRNDDFDQVSLLLPEYNGIKDLRVLVKESVLKINKTYDSTLRVIHIKQIEQLQRVDSLSNEYSRKILGLFRRKYKSK